MLRGDVLDRLHHLGEIGVVGRAHRRERDAAVADGDRRDAVPARGRADRIPRELRVEMGVDVDEPRRDEPPVGVDLAPAAVVDRADRGDPVAVDGDVGPRRARRCRR